jgi:hypothetical protein
MVARKEKRKKNNPAAIFFLFRVENGSGPPKAANGGAVKENVGAFLFTIPLRQAAAPLSCVLWRREERLL